MKDIYSKEINGIHYLKELNRTTGKLEWIEIIVGNKNNISSHNGTT
jgi:hypothetical protein